MAAIRDNSTVLSVNAPFNTTPPYSGNFNPVIWSAKLNAKFYRATLFGDIANTSYQGEISAYGDKVIINTAPDTVIRDYKPGTNLQYDVPVPITQELLIDRAKYFAFQANDVMEKQAKPALLDMFAVDAAERMKIRIDSDVLYMMLTGAAATNKGAAAGVGSGAYNLGTDAAPVALTAANVLQKILEMASVLDEANIPDTDRWLLIDPLTRMMLLNSDLKQAQITGDSTSPVRNGLIGAIDRFKIYLTNQLPRGAAGASTPWVSGDGSDSSVVSAGTAAKRRVLMAGHKSAVTFASQMTKTETVRNPSDFGDYVRSLNVYGCKVLVPDAMVTAVVA